MSIWVRLPPTAALLAFGVINISPTCELNVFCSNVLLLCQHFALCFSIPIMPKFMRPIPTHVMYTDCVAMYSYSNHAHVIEMLMSWHST